MSTRPFFIVGFPRSGTTMLRFMLNKHSRIAVPFESDFIPKYYRRLDAYGDLRDPGNVARLLQDIGRESFVVKGNLIPDPDAVLGALPRSYAELVDRIFSVYARLQGKQRWGDKDPDNLQEMDVLWKLFPASRFIHIIRDGRDVALSMRELDWGSRNLPRVARKWAQQVTLARRVGNVLGEDCYREVSYEALVHRPAEVLQGVCTFLGESFEPTMLDYHLDAQRWLPATSLRYHTTSIRRPDPEKVQLWRRRMSRADRAIFDDEAGSTLEQCGYERSRESSRVSSGLRSTYYALFARW